MATVMKNKTDLLLQEVLAEVREVRALVEPIAYAVKKVPRKKLLAGLQVALRDVEAGRVSGPFRDVTKLMAHLER